MQTRREIICSGLGLVGIIAAGKAPAAVVKSMLSTRKEIAAGGGDKPHSAKSYVQDGLVAMWDGIENAGWGVHDPNATVWKDLVGGFGDWEIPNSTVYENYIHLTNDKPIIETTYRLGGTWQFVYGDIKQTSSPVILIFGRVKSYTSGLFMFPYYYFNEGCEQWWLNQSGFRPFLNASPSGFHSRTCVVSSNIVFYDGDVEALNRTGDYQGRTFDLLSIGGYNGGSSNVKCMSMRYYSRALTADDIAANYAIDKVRFNLD